jgi:hypothetical protein
MQETKFSSPVFEPVTQKIIAELTAAKNILDSNSPLIPATKETQAAATETALVEGLLKPAMDQFLFIARIAEDTRKVCENVFGHR